MSETIAQNRVFIYEPHLVSNIARLVCYDNHVPMVSVVVFKNLKVCMCLKLLPGC